VDSIQRFLTSPIGRKVMNAVTGLSLIMFLVVHLLGNLALLKGDGGVSFNTYAHFLESLSLILVAEVGLLAGFLYHALGALTLQLRNWRSKPVRYAVTRSAGHTSRQTIASKTMIWSGAVIFLFVVLHVATMKYRLAGDANVTLYRLVRTWFENPVVVLGYVVAVGLLGFHLWHGFGSVFESLGVRHRMGLRRAGQVVGTLTTIGFLSIPIVLFLQ